MTPDDDRDDAAHLHTGTDPADDDATLDDRLRAAREAVYRKDAEAGAIERLRELTAQAAVASAADAPDAPVPAPEPEPAPAPDDTDHPTAAAQGAAAPALRGPRRMGRLVAVAGTALLVGAVAGVLVGPSVRASAPAASASSTAPPSAQQQLQQRVVDSRGSLTAQDYYRLFPDDLPNGWGAASTGTSFTRLQGDASIRLSPAASSSDLLLYAVCPADDGRYTWRLSKHRGPAAAVGGGQGACGRMQRDPVALPLSTAGGLDLTVSTKGDVPFSVTVLER